MNLNIIDDDQILRAYSIDNINAVFKQPCTQHEVNCKTAFMLLKDGLTDVLQHCCIHNEYILDAPNDKYVKMHGITIDTSYKKNRLGKKLIYQNQLVYKENGFNRIILKAIRDGVVAWRRIGFHFDNNLDEKRILKKIKEYLIEVKNMSIEEVREYKTIKEIDVSLLFDESINFTDKIKDDDSTQNLHMTLRIA